MGAPLRVIHISIPTVAHSIRNKFPFTMAHTTFNFPAFRTRENGIIYSSQGICRPIRKIVFLPLSSDSGII